MNPFRRKLRDLPSSRALTTTDIARAKNKEVTTGRFGTRNIQKLMKNAKLTTFEKYIYQSKNVKQRIESAKETLALECVRLNQKIPHYLRKTSGKSSGLRQQEINELSKLLEPAEQQDQNNLFGDKDKTLSSQQKEAEPTTRSSTNQQHNQLVDGTMKQIKEQIKDSPLLLKHLDINRFEQLLREEAPTNQNIKEAYKLVQEAQKKAIEEMRQKFNKSELSNSQRNFAWQVIKSQASGIMKTLNEFEVMSKVNHHLGSSEYLSEHLDVDEFEELIKEADIEGAIDLLKEAYENAKEDIYNDSELTKKHSAEQSLNSEFSKILEILKQHFPDKVEVPIVMLRVKNHLQGSSLSYYLDTDKLKQLLINNQIQESLDLIAKAALEVNKYEPYKERATTDLTKKITNLLLPLSKKAEK